MKFAEKTVEEFLYTPGKSFTIPVFQRPYSWQVSNIREFLSDLESTMENGRKHYFGAVVFVMDDIDSNSIIDGQQRVTTAIIMIMAIYHLMKEEEGRSLSMSPGEVNEKYLAQSARFDGVNRELGRVKLRTVTTDDLILQKIYKTGGDESSLSSDEQKSNIYQAYAEFRQLLSDKDNLDEYIKALSNFEIITIALDAKDDNPQRVFESINSTGRPLSEGDKIRNFALMLNIEASRKYVYDRYWIEIESSLTESNKDHITDFFRYYVISKKNAMIRWNASYPEFKRLFTENISTNQAVEEIDAFYGDILRNLYYYRFLKFEYDPAQRYQTSDLSDVRDAVFSMRYIQTELYIPFAMTVLSYHEDGGITDQELSEVFSIIKTYFSRRIVCNITTTSVDKFLASLHSDVIEHMNDNEGATYVDVVKYLFLRRTGSTRMPSDGEIEVAIKSNEIYNQRKSHVSYVLASVDNQSKDSALLKQIMTERELTIEHVMPQRLNRDWYRELGSDKIGEDGVREIHSRYLHTLANLTLTGYNQEYQNFSFERKKTMRNGFNDSPLSINRWIAEQQQWDEGVLLERQNWWIEGLKEIWPLPVTSFKPKSKERDVYLLDETDLKGEEIRSIIVFGDYTPVTAWSDALNVVAEKMYDKYADFTDAVVEDGQLGRFFDSDKERFYNSAEVYDTGLFVDTGTDTNTKLRVIKRLAKIFNLDKNDIVAGILNRKS